MISSFPIMKVSYHSPIRLRLEFLILFSKLSKQDKIKKHISYGIRNYKNKYVGIYENKNNNSVERLLSCQIQERENIIIIKILLNY